MARTWLIPLALVLCPTAAAADTAEEHVAALLESRGIPMHGAAAAGIGVRMEVGAPTLGSLELAGNLSIAAALENVAAGETELAGVAVRVGAVARQPVARAELDGDLALRLWLEVGGGAELLPGTEVVRPDATLGFATDGGTDEVSLWLGWRVHAAPELDRLDSMPPAVAAGRASEPRGVDLGWSSVVGVRWTP